MTNIIHLANILQIGLGNVLSTEGVSWHEHCGRELARLSINVGCGHNFSELDYRRDILSSTTGR